MLRKTLRRLRKSGVVWVVALALLASVPAFGLTRTSSDFKVGPKSKLDAVRYPDFPDEVRVIELHPDTAVPDIVPADGAYPMWGLTSAMSANAGAIVGVNGDFGTAKGQPKHVLMIDGELWTTGQQHGTAVAWSADGTRAYAGRPDLKILGVDKTTGAAFYAPQWNVGTPKDGVIGAFTARGGSVTRPPGTTSPTAADPSWCAARLEPTTGIKWNGTKRTSLVRKYTVTVQQEPCPKTPLPVGTTKGAVVLASKYKTGVVNKVLGLSVGDTVKISWTFKGWRGVTDVMGAGQMLVDKGTNVAPPWVTGADHILDYNPRTSVGITKACMDNDVNTVCKLIMITVDGRQTATNWSKGVRLPFLAKLQMHAGAWFAVNLDGGGSTTVWTKKKDTYCQSYPAAGGCLANRPYGSSQNERATRSAIVILPSADAGTPSALK